MGQARCALVSVWTRSGELSAPAPADQGNPMRATIVVAAMAATTRIATISAKPGRDRGASDAERAMRQSFPARAGDDHATMSDTRTTFAGNVSSHTSPITARTPTG